MKVIAIDLGVNGAICEGTFGGEIQKIIPMPKKIGELADMFVDYIEISNRAGLITVVEDVGHTFPGNSARSAYTFARHRGQVEAMFEILDIQVFWVKPQVWMKYIGIESGINKRIRKDKIYDIVSKRFKNVNIHKYQADAVGLYMYIIESKPKIKIVNESGDKDFGANTIIIN